MLQTCGTSINPVSFVVIVNGSSQYLEQNYKVHKHNTRRKLDIHVKLQKNEIYKKSVKNMGTKVYNNVKVFKGNKTIIKPLRKS